MTEEKDNKKMDEKIEQLIEKKVEEKLKEQRQEKEEVSEQEVERKVQEKIDGKLELGADEEDQKDVTQKAKEGIEKNNDDGITRRSFLKTLGLGAGALGLSSMASADFIKLTGSASIQSSSDVVVTDTQVGTLSDGEFLQNSGGSLTGSSVQGGFSNIEVFESDGTFDASNVDRAFVEVVGGGGAGGPPINNGFNAGTGGAGGGYSAGYYDMSGISSVTVTVGSGGTSVQENGGTSSFGSFLSATGGDGGDSAGFADADTFAGSGSGGQINLEGSDGGQAMRDDSGDKEVIGGDGGDSKMGGGGSGAGRSDLSTASNGNKYGGGGGGAATNQTNGYGEGADGVVIVRH